MECDIKRDQQLVANESGQSTVEYALVFTAFLAVIAGMGALMGLLEDGIVARHAVMSASHCLSSALSGLTDAFCF